jgi:hypothetical protein
MSLKLNSSGGGSVLLQEPVTASTLTLNLPAFSGTAATLASVTNNGVLYVNSSGQPTTGSALTFDGNTLKAPNVNVSDSNWVGWGSDRTRLVGNSSTNFLAAFIDNAEQMRLTSTGLGIGTTSPTQKLQVAGNIYMSAGDTFRIKNSASNTAFIRAEENASTAAFTYATMDGRSTGYWAFSTNDTERMRLDSSGNLGLGVTPSAWNSAYRALDIGNAFGLIGASGAADLYANAFLNSGGSFIYKTTAAAAAYSLAGGQHRWYTAPSGTTGNAISFTQAMTLDASGRLFIGQTSNGNNAIFQLRGVNGSTGDIGIDSNGSYSEIQSFNVKPLYINRQGNNVIVGVESGNLLVGTTTARSKLTLNGAAHIGGGGKSNGYLVDFSTTQQSVGVTSSFSSPVAFLDLYAGGDPVNLGGWEGAIRFLVGGNSQFGSERARINSSGVLLLGKSATNIANAGWELGPNGGAQTVTISGSNQAFVYNNTSTSGTATVAFRTAGVEKGYIAWTNSATSYSTTSDYRLKNTVAPMTGALAKVALLKPCTYKWKADGSDGEGFIAHELAEVCPSAVTGAKDAVDTEGNPQYQGIDTSFLVATVVAALQELKAELDTVKAELAAMKGTA